MVATPQDAFSKAGDDLCCKALGEDAMAKHIRDILLQEQDHQIALAGALESVVKARESLAPFLY